MKEHAVRVATRLHGHRDVGHLARLDRGHGEARVDGAAREASGVLLSNEALLLCRGHEHAHGERARVGTFMHDRVFMVAGPLALARRDGAAALRVDYGALTAHDPATRSRVDAWVRVAPSVVGRPEWAFVKLHTHGAPEAQAESLLGDGGHARHRSLAELVANGATRLHYVTARELYNVACAAMMGRPERPQALRDSVLGPPPRATRHGT